jgi:hypothetical protein
MHSEKTNMGDTCSVSVGRGASHDEGVQMHGRYDVVCYGADGVVKWEEVIENLVTVTGKMLTLTGALTNTAQGAAFMGLKGTGTASVDDTQATHATWLEVGSTNAPSYTSPRKTITWASAVNATPSATITPTAVQVFAMTGSGTVAGCFINVGGTSAILNTTGTLFSAGDFTAGSKTVTSGDTLSVTYTATAA